MVVNIPAPWSIWNILRVQPFLPAKSAKCPESRWWHFAASPCWTPTLCEVFKQSRVTLRCQTWQAGKSTRNGSFNRKIIYKYLYIVYLCVFSIATFDYRRVLSWTFCRDFFFLCDHHPALSGSHNFTKSYG